MECDLLTMDVGSCTDKAFKGFARTGWWTPLSNVDPASIVETDAGVTFALRSGQFYEIFDGSKMPFADTMPVTTFTGKHGFPQHTDKVAFPLKELSPNSSELIKSIASGIPIVIMLEQTDGGDGRFPVYGLFGGLHGSPEMTFELNDERCWEVILEAFNTGYPQRFLFDTDQAGTLAMKTLLTDYEYITGLSIGAGNVTPQAVELVVDDSLTAYIVLPNGTILTTSSGVISTTWTSAAGSVILILPKEQVGVVDISNSDFIGIYSSAYTEQITTTNSANITGIDCVNASNLLSDSCAITAANANTIFLNADASGIEDGQISLDNQSTLLTYTDLSVSAQSAITSLLAKNWNIVIPDIP